MKTSQWAAVSAAVIAVSTLVSPRAHSQILPVGLTGSLSANPAIVQAGQTPKLKWNINYPSVVKQFVTIIPSGSGSGSTGGTLTPMQPLYADVRILGQGVTFTATGSTSFTYVPTEAVMSYNSTTSYRRLFYGTNPSINPGAIVSTSTILTNSLVEANKPLRFGGRFYFNGQWSTFYRSHDGNDNIRYLVNGDVPPSNVPSYNAPSLKSFLRPYLDSAGYVKIGPMDVIVFMELTHSSSQKSNAGYDLQDMVLLVTFRKN